MKSKENGKLSFHFCADEATIETNVRTIIFVNQLSIHGALADLCEEFPQTLPVPDKTYFVMERSESLVAPTDLFDIQKFPTHVQEQGDLLFHHRESVQNLSDEEQLIKLSTNVGFVKTVSCSWTILHGMDSHGGLEVTIRQTESKKKNYPTTS